MSILKLVRNIEIKAHQGDYGSWRRDYCRSYRAVMDRICRQAYDEFKHYRESTGEILSCRRGCAYCCEQYISISLAHGLVIADYLYSKPALLGIFLKNYEKWRNFLAGISALEELEKYTTFSYLVKRTPQELLNRYAELQIRCPFLSGNDCSIYAVRPICCASHISISAPEYCKADSVNQAMIYEAVPSQEGLGELAMLGEPALSFHQETMPLLVFRLLTEGLPEVLRKLQLMAEQQGTDSWTQA